MRARIDINSTSPGRRQFCLYHDVMKYDVMKYDVTKFICNFFSEKRQILRWNSTFVLPIYENRNRVKVCLVRMHGHGCCDKLSYAVMASWLLPAIDFSVLPEVLLFFVFIPWMILSPSWEQTIDLMIKDCRLRRSDKSLFKTELFSV